MKQALLPLAIAVMAATAQAGTVTSDGTDIVLKTKGGLSATTTDGQYGFQLGGRAQLDFNSYDGVMNASASDPGSEASDVFFRRARVEMKGFANDWAYEMSYNLGIDNIESGVYALFVTYTGFGKLFNVAMGKQKEDFGLDDTGSSKWTTAMERAMVVSAFDTGENNGVKFHGSNDNFNYSIGAYKQGIDTDYALDSAVTGRVVVRPIYVKDGEVLHFGAGFTTRSADEGFDDLDARIGIRGGALGAATKWEPKFISADGDKTTAYNLEAAYITGPLHLQAEYYSGSVDAPDSVAGSDDLEADGYYLQAGWILTGETRSYKTDFGILDKVKPSSKTGAWEVFARLDQLNADSGDNITLVGGEDVNALTLGVNWYANELVKISVNYVTAETDSEIRGEDEGQAITGRLQYAF